MAHHTIKHTPLWTVHVPPPWTPDNPDYQWLQHQHSNAIPSVLTEPHPHHHAIGLPLIQWHTAIYRALADRTHLTGSTHRHWKRRHRYELADAIEAIYQLAPPHTPSRVRNAIHTFYTQLLASGLLDNQPSTQRSTQLTGRASAQWPTQEGGNPMNDWNPRCQYCGTTWEAMYGPEEAADNPAARGWNITDDGIVTCCDCEWRISTGALPTTITSC